MANREGHSENEVSDTEDAICPFAICSAVGSGSAVTMLQPALCSTQQQHDTMGTVACLTERAVCEGRLAVMIINGGCPACNASSGSGTCPVRSATNLEDIPVPSVYQIRLS